MDENKTDVPTDDELRELYDKPMREDFEMSPTLGQLAKALAAAQGEMQNPAFDASNPFYSTQQKTAKYATLAAVRDSVIPAMSKHGIAVMQLPYVDRPMDAETIAGVVTLAVHESGEWVRSRIGFRPMRANKGQAPAPSDDAQSVGGATTYARRYALQGLACVVGDHDDDGNRVSGIHPESDERKPERTARQRANAENLKAAAAKRKADAEKKKAAEAAAAKAAEEAPKADAEQIQKVLDAASKLKISPSDLDKVVAKYAAQAGEPGATFDLMGPKTAKLVIEAAAKKLAKKQEQTKTGGDDPERGRAMQALQDLVNEHSLKEGDIRAVLKDGFNGASVPDLSTEELESLHVLLKERYEKRAQDDDMDIDLSGEGE